MSSHDRFCNTMTHPVDFTRLLFGLLFIPMGLAAIADNYFYDGAGTTTSNCHVRACDPTKCGNGFYLSGCGGPSNPTAPGVCTSPCTNKPLHSTYTSNGGLSASGCTWQCDTPTYTLYQGACVLSSCVATITEVSAGTYTIIDNTPGVCTYTCKAGYYGPVAASGARGPATCTACLETKYSAADGATTCSICGAGKFQTGTAKTGCQDCIAPYYNDITTGATVCKNCPTTCPIGSFTNGCTGASPGTCAFCNNYP